MAINDTNDISQAEADRICALLKSALKDTHRQSTGSLSMVYLTEPSVGVRGASVISIIRPEDNTAASESMVM